MTKAITYAEYGAMLADLTDVISWGIESDGRSTFEVSDSAVADRLVECHRVDAASALEVAKMICGWLEAGGARRVYSLTAA
jgi:hypothetical protein